jgi:hypothetical protein
MAAEHLLAAAKADRSFAGPFAYDGQPPAKTLLGSSPVVPLRPLLAALDAMQAGAASPKQKEAAVQVLKPSANECTAKCSKQTQLCYAAQGVTMSSASKEQHLKCAEPASACLATCPAVL